MIDVAMTNSAPVAEMIDEMLERIERETEENFQQQQQQDSSESYTASRGKFRFSDPEIGFRVIKSFGAMRVVFKFMTQLEVTKMQQGNRFLYDKAVSRCQVSINLE